MNSPIVLDYKYFYFLYFVAGCLIGTIILSIILTINSSYGIDNDSIEGNGNKINNKKENKDDKKTFKDENIVVDKK
eukprot:TRINITY_DN22111_c0_g1_i1.p1 TRINITY_DN22111_c0_g1~~TRINITY_DN22111_c0_g1_i1.p1  ORF type:complete len:76 (+),score=2.12 TRINITY_DN22111_c0_g1_i1:2-229(+)